VVSILPTLEAPEVQVDLEPSKVQQDHRMSYLKPQMYALWEACLPSSPEIEQRLKTSSMESKPIYVSIEKSQASTHL